MYVMIEPANKRKQFGRKHKIQKFPRFGQWLQVGSESIFFWFWCWPSFVKLWESLGVQHRLAKLSSLWAGLTIDNAVSATGQRLLLSRLLLMQRQLIWASCENAGDLSNLLTGKCSRRVINLRFLDLWYHNKSARSGVDDLMIRRTSLQNLGTIGYYYRGCVFTALEGLGGAGAVCRSPCVCTLGSTTALAASRKSSGGSRVLWNICQGLQRFLQSEVRADAWRPVTRHCRCSPQPPLLLPHSPLAVTGLKLSVGRSR